MVVTHSPETAPHVVPAAGARADELQPGHHWTGQPLIEDDTDSTLGDDAASSTASIASTILRYRTVNGRTYHSDSIASNSYWGANDDAQNATLDIQHHVFDLLLGGLYLAPLPKTLDKVVDVGTGTGFWAIDFADQHPEATVIGTDLSPIQPKWVPPNVHFEIDDMTQQWTFEEDSIDFVHGRWLTGCVPDYAALFKEAYRTLKPGGWIESIECNAYLETDDDSMPEDSACAQWGYIFREGAKKMGSTVSFSVVRDKLQRKDLEAAGFINIQERPLKNPISEWSKDPKLKEIGQFTRLAWENDPEDSMTLGNVSLEIQAGEKFGICGRSGSGKSSFLATIFRMLDIRGGSIEIDSVNIQTIPLVDLETEKLMQDILKEAFRDCTVIAIAHRLDTLIEFDRIAVFDNGKVEECGAPRDLLEKQDSAFKKFWAAA
ncbi:hypothetical protein CMQ_4141 [Grosmannia clavigera kw1407]|uniref:ABC transporter domain-containing protein n=1 Tax=Grosmannia clavigera (strain kw1407 / UAMH 11150) TaxID=655863 RepID=F0X9J9_GROCL|nr:uncharacterized protein CMQ_4141 [Grosmannia clavigera kw1407]EFX06072.1 hypothetical protein CMQ_4141 [Grosmannia clavigera kw1407]